MRTSTAWIARMSLGLAAVAGVVVADETGSKSAPTPQRPIRQSFLDGLVGSWSTKSTMTHDGKEMSGTGTSTFEKGIGDTALLQTYESTGPGPDGGTMTYHGHGVFKIADDGQQMNGWWFCNMSPDAMKLTGTVSDSGFELTGDGPKGKMTVKMTKSADGLTFTGTEGSTETLKETYTRK